MNWLRDGGYDAGFTDFTHANATCLTLSSLWGYVASNIIIIIIIIFIFFTIITIVLLFFFITSVIRIIVLVWCIK